MAFLLIAFSSQADPCYVCRLWDVEQWGNFSKAQKDSGRKKLKRLARNEQHHLFPSTLKGMEHKGLLGNLGPIPVLTVHPL